MSNKYTAVTLSVLVLLFVSCKKELTRPEGEGSIMTFYADGGDTRTVLKSNGNIFWTPAEAIDIAQGTQSGVFVSTNTTVSSTVEFKGRIPNLVRDPEKYFYAIYPHSDKNEFSNNSVYVYLPDTQEASDNTFADNLFPSVARTKDNTLHFQNIVGGVKFSMTRDGVKKVVFKENSGSPMAGKMYVFWTNSGVPQFGSLYDESYSVSLVAPDGGTLKSGTWYYLALLPINLYGYSMEFVADNWVGSYSSDNFQRVLRSTWGVLNHGEAINPKRMFSVTYEPLEFEDVQIGETKTLTFAVTNNTESNQIIAMGCPYGFLVSPGPVVEIAAKSTRTFDLSFTPKEEKDYSGVVEVDFYQKHTLFVHMNAKGVQNQTVEPVPIDMGLSVKWASFNVGASKQEDCGSYFAWGETDPEKTSFSWTTYKWSGGVYQDEMTKYCTLASEGLNGFKDNKVTLEPDDDAARKFYGSNWRMPTKAEFEELIDPGKCIVKWDSLNGVPGLKVTSKKTGKFIFLPAAGGKSGDSMSGLNTFGRYWSSSLNEEGPYSAHYLYFKADNCYLYNYYRYYGYPVRAVYVE